MLAAVSANSKPLLKVVFDCDSPGMLECTSFFQQCNIMTKNSNKVWLVVGVLVFFAFTGTSQTLDDREPKSVIEYYLLLPLKFLPYLPTDSRSEREKAVRMKSLDG